LKPEVQSKSKPANLTQVRFNQHYETQPVLKSKAQSEPKPANLTHVRFDQHHET